MTPDDRELLHTLRDEERELRRALARLEARLGELEARAGQSTSEPLPPVPSLSHPPPIPEPVLPPVPPILHATLPPIPREPQPSLEFRLGRWLTRLGALFFVLFLVSADAYFHIHRLLGPWGKFGLMGLISMVAVAVGQRLERKSLLAYGRTVMAAGLAGLYFTLYAVTSLETTRLISQPLIGGMLLLLWSVYVFQLADRRRSQLLALFALTLAYISSALNPVVAFTMTADFILAATAVLFLLRRGWTVLSYLALAGTYLALLRRLVVNEDNELVFDTSRALAFAPHAFYLVAAWAVFTVAVFLARGWQGGKRFAFLTLNNGAAAGLLVLTASISGYGSGRMGWVLLLSGIALLVVAALATRWRTDAPEVTNAYLAQGIALATGGLMAVSTGTTRAILLLIEILFLGLAGAFSRGRILAVCAWVIAFFATLFLLWEVGVNARHPWLLGLGGTVVMFKNGWWSRRAAKADPETLVPATSYYCALGLSLLATFLTMELNTNALPPALALAALIGTWLVRKLPELPPLAQLLLLGAQFLVLFPAETGEPLPAWSMALVALATLLMILSFRRLVRMTPGWQLLDFVYALALVGLAYQSVRPRLHEQLWMIDASLLSLAFLAFGALTRVWSIAAMGQVFLAIALYHFFQLNDEPSRFPWTAWGAALPLTAVFATGRGIHGWLRTFPAITGERRHLLRAMAYGYQLLALLMLVRCVVGLVPFAIQVSTFLLLGTITLTLNVRRLRVFGVRCSFVLSGLGALLYAYHFRQEARLTFLGSLAMLSFLTQPAILRHAARQIGTNIEAILLILISSATGWLYFTNGIAARLGNGSITGAWTVYALFLFVLGLLLNERRQRWCGLAILLAAVGRVFCVDFWGLTSGYRVLTFIVLTIVTLGLGFIYARYAERLKTLL